jgi:hypothetical protein
METNKIIEILKNRYIDAHCNPDFKGNKLDYIFAPIEALQSSPTPTESDCDHVFVVDASVSVDKMKCCKCGKLTDLIF